MKVKQLSEERKRVQQRESLLEMSRGKYKVAVDENLHSLGQRLKDLRFNVFFYQQGLPDNELNDILNRDNIKYFITKNGKDFIHLNRRYVLIWVNINYEEIGLSKIIEKILMKKIIKSYQSSIMGDIIMVNPNLIDRLL